MLCTQRFLSPQDLMTHYSSKLSNLDLFDFLGVLVIFFACILEALELTDSVSEPGKPFKSALLANATGEPSALKLPPGESCSGVVSSRSTLSVSCCVALRPSSSSSVSYPFVADLTAS